MAAGIVDSKDIMDISQYIHNIKVDSMDHLLCTGLFTWPQYSSSTRMIMWASHMKQYMVIENPDFPRYFTNYENVFGELSSSIKRAHANMEVFKIIDKFPWKKRHLYMIFLYDRKEDKYHVIEKEINCNLTEKFGYAYNTEYIDNLNEGDDVLKDDVLIKSTSYDQYNNYCYGKNALVLYMIDNRTIEDAIVVSESFAKSMVSKEVETVTIPLNDNDILLNLFGDGDDYKGLPEIGTVITDYLIASKRRVDNNQLLFTMKKSSLTESNSLNDNELYCNGKVTDIMIYCNQPIEDIPDIACNKQLLKYLHNQIRYWTEIKDVCEFIIEQSGSKYDQDIGYYLGTARQHLSENYRYKDNERVFNNMIIEISVEKDVALNVGYKLTGRYGNKGVISQVLPDEKMPRLDDGRHVDMIMNALSIINRLISGPLLEVSYNFCSDRIIEYMRTLDDIDEQAKILFKYLENFNLRGEKDKLEEYFNNLSDDGQKEFMDDLLANNNIYITDPPIDPKNDGFDKVAKIHKDFPFIKPYKVYVSKWGRDIELMNTMIAGEQYIIKLKQTAKKNFSVRSTGYLSQKGLPDKSNKSKHNQQLYSTTPIKIGRDENNNLAIGVDSRTLAKFHLFYRSSPAARREMGKLFTKDCLNFKKFKIKDSFKNRNAEILSAYLKSEGYRINYGFKGIVIPDRSDRINSYMYKKVLHICSREEMREYLLEEKWSKEFNEIAHVGPIDEIEEDYAKFKAKERKKLDKLTDILAGGSPKKKKSKKVYEVKIGNIKNQ